MKRHVYQLPALATKSLDQLELATDVNFALMVHILTNPELHASEEEQPVPALKDYHRMVTHASTATLMKSEIHSTKPNVSQLIATEMTKSLVELETVTDALLAKQDGTQITQEEYASDLEQHVDAQRNLNRWFHMHQMCTILDQIIHQLELMCSCSHMSGFKPNLRYFPTMLSMHLMSSWFGTRRTKKTLQITSSNLWLYRKVFY